MEGYALRNSIVYCDTPAIFFAKIKIGSLKKVDNSYEAILTRDSACEVNSLNVSDVKNPARNLGAVLPLSDYDGTYDTLYENILKLGVSEGAAKDLVHHAARKAEVDFNH